MNDVLQIGAYSKVDRAPRGRTVTVAYLAIVDAPMAVKGQDDAAKAEWFGLSALPQLAFDHADIMRDAIRLYNQLMETMTQDRFARFKEQKERMHTISEQIREQCTHVQELCRNFNNRKQNDNLQFDIR